MNRRKSHSSGVPALRRERSDQPLHVFFIGNSYTNTNDLPEMFAALARSAGCMLEVGASAPSGWTLSDHARAKRTLSSLAKQKWDFVILQEQSVIPSVAPERNRMMYPAARSLCRKIRDRGADAIFFMTWGRRDGLPSLGTRDFLDMQVKLYYAYLSIARELNAELAPVGIAWEREVQQDSTPDLWQTDGTHPSEKGTYLTACVFYAVIYQQSPEGLTYTDGLSLETARHLQKIAAETVLNCPECWNLV